MFAKSKKRSAEPGAAQEAPATGRTKQHLADAPCGARSKRCLREIQGPKPRVAVSLEAARTHASLRNVDGPCGTVAWWFVSPNCRWENWPGTLPGSTMEV
jgi:hypothetical protein